MATKADESEGIRPNTAANMVNRITVRFIVGWVSRPHSPVAHGAMRALGRKVILMDRSRFHSGL
jgi:hypothetical protein